MSTLPRAVWPADDSLSAVAVQQLEIMAGVFGFDTNGRYLEGSLLAGQYGCACVAARRMVGEATHAYLAYRGVIDYTANPNAEREGSSDWTPNSCPSRQLESLRSLDGDGSAIYRMATELMRLPARLDAHHVTIYGDSCRSFGIDLVGVHRLGVPFMEHHTSDREPRYRFLRTWGSLVLEKGEATSYPERQLRSAIEGGRGNVAPSFADDGSARPG